MALLAAGAAASAGPPPAGPVRAAAAADTLAESAPAPLVGPGRPNPSAQETRSRQELAREHYLRGRTLDEARAPASAMAEYRVALSLDPSIPDANYRVGCLFQKAGQVAEAVKSFSAEVEHHPSNLVAARELGLALAQTGEHDRALKQLELLTRRLPRDGESWRALGYARMRAGRPVEAERALRRALSLPPETALEHRDLGYVLAATGREREARDEYRRAGELDPKDPSVWINLANLDRAQGDHGKALAGYREAEKRDSSMVPAVRGQAQMLEELQRPEEAATTWRRLLGLEPGDTEARLRAVELYDGLGRQDVALELARGGVRYDRRSAEARLILGMALQARGATREAVLEMRRAESLARDREGRERARKLMGVVRAGAPDSLRALLVADSAAFVQAERARRDEPGARPDSATVR